MDPLFERFERLVRSLFHDREDDDRHDRPFEHRSGRPGERDYIFSEHHDFSNHRDPDFRDAWEELDDYLRTGRTEERDAPGSSYYDPFGGGSPGGGGATSSRTYRDTGGRGPFGARRGEDLRGGFRVRPTRRPPEELRKDYRVLGVSFGAPFEEVRKAYRSLIRDHHPDRFADDVRESDRATTRSQDINESFQRIKKWEEDGRRPD